MQCQENSFQNNELVYIVDGINQTVKFTKTFGHERQFVFEAFLKHYKTLHFLSDKIREKVLQIKIDVFFRNKNV